MAPSLEAKITPDAPLSGKKELEAFAFGRVPDYLHMVAGCRLQNRCSLPFTPEGLTGG